jgi:hypothetical protein
MSTAHLGRDERRCWCRVPIGSDQGADMRHVESMMKLALCERELSAALRDYEFSGAPGAHETVCLAICGCVDIMRAMGWAPERVVVAIKRIARHSGFDSSHGTGARRTADHDRCVEGFVSHAIRRYFHLSATSLAGPIVRVAPISLVS